MLRYKTETRPGLVALYDIRQEMERVNSYNPGARTGLHIHGSSALNWAENLWHIVEKPVQTPRQQCTCIIHSYVHHYTSLSCTEYISYYRHAAADTEDSDTVNYYQLVFSFC